MCSSLREIKKKILIISWVKVEEFAFSFDRLAYDTVYSCRYEVLFRVISLVHRIRVWFAEGNVDFFLFFFHVRFLVSTKIYDKLILKNN